MLDAYQAAIDELAWRFGSAEAAIGIRAQSIGDAHGPTIWDEAVSERAHLARRNDIYRHRVQRLAKIDATLRKCRKESVETLRQGFEPFGRVTALLASAFTISSKSDAARGEADDAGVPICLLGLAVRTRAARVYYTKAIGFAAPDLMEVVRWLEGEARSLERMVKEIKRMRTGRPSAHFFERIEREAIVKLTSALEEYNGARDERILGEREARAERAAESAQENQALIEQMRAEREQRSLRLVHAQRVNELAALVDLALADGVS